MVKRMFYLNLFLAWTGIAKAQIPEQDIIPNKDIALKVSEAILVGAYGKEVLKQKPFQVSDSNGIWIIEGTSHCAKGKICSGGTARIEIVRKNGTVQKLIHEK